MLYRVALGGVLFLSSVGTIQKYLGTAAAVVSLPICIAAAVLGLPQIEPVVIRVSERQAVGIAIAGIVVLAVALVVVYPHANTHAVGSGSDRDDAADLGAHRILHGRYPYGPRTYLGLPISQMPGALALAVPFTAMGHSAYANVFWLAVLLAMLALAAGAISIAVGVGAAAIILSPGLVREYLTGGDLIANAVYVAVAATLVYAAVHRRFAGLAAAALLGVALASRANFVLVLVPLAIAIHSRTGLRRTISLLGVVAGVALGLVLIPLVRPAGRESFRISNHLDVLGRVGSGLTIAAAILLALYLALRRRNWTATEILWQSALVQALFPLALVIHASVVAHSLDASSLISGYGVPAYLLALPSAAAAAVSSARWEGRVRKAPLAIIARHRDVWTPT